MFLSPGAGESTSPYQALARCFDDGASSRGTASRGGAGMIGQHPSRLNFSPAQTIVDCKQEANQGVISQMGSLVWQLLPLCGEHIEEPSRSDEPVSLSAHRHRINEQLAVIQHLQRRKRRIAHAYVRLRRQHAHGKALRALRWRLNQAYKVETMEVEP